MADTKITGLTADTSPSSSDIVPTVKDPGGTPLNRKVTLANTVKGGFGMSAKGDIATYSTVPAVLGVGTNGYVLTAASGETTGIKWDANPFAPWLVDIIPMISDPSAATGTWALINFTGDNVTYPFVNSIAGQSFGATALYNSTTAQNDAVSWDVILSAGTWNASFHVRKSTNTGIITLNIDGSSAGTADTYAAAVAYGKVTITGWTVSTDGKHTMQLKMATKHASSSGYLLEIFGISLRRTA